MASLLQRMSTRSNLPAPEQVAALSSTWPATTSGTSVFRTYPQYVIYALESNAVVHACVQTRMQLLAQAEFKWQDKTTGKLFSSPELDLLNNPWPNGTSTDLIALMEQNNSAAGNAFVRRVSPSRLEVFRPDWVDVIRREVVDGYDDRGNAIVRYETQGYTYTEGGPGVGEPIFFNVGEIAHWTPLPDPLAPWHGMSWMTPVLREINADTSMTQHRQTFFDNAGTPNMILKYKQRLGEDTLDRLRKRWNARFGGPKGAGATVILDEDGDLQVVGSTFESMRFTELQSAVEARIAAASGVPAIVAGLQAGLDAATYSNYGQAVRSFANGPGAYLWRSLVASLAKLVTPPNNGCRLWWDTANVPALREDEKDRAANMATMLSAASTGLMSGWTPDSLVTYLQTADLGQLKHSGNLSVQLYNAEAKQEPTQALVPPVLPSTLTPPTVHAA